MQGLNFEQCVTTLNVNAEFSRLNSKAWCHITNSHHFYCLRHVLHLHTVLEEIAGIPIEVSAGEPDYIPPQHLDLETDPVSERRLRNPTAKYLTMFQ